MLIVPDAHALLHAIASSVISSVILFIAFSF